MKRAKTLYTAGFEASKAHGFVVKCGKCRFKQGTPDEYDLREVWYITLDANKELTIELL